jgi:hypothetical protein
MGAWRRADPTRSCGWTYAHAVSIGSDTTYATAVLDGKITNIPEYIDTQAQARAAQRNASAPAQCRPWRHSSRSMANEPWTAALHVIRSSNSLP